MIDLSSENLLSMAEAARLMPRRRRGRPCSIATLYRWSNPPGVKGIVLETADLGGGRITSREALQRFADALTSLRVGQVPAPAPLPKHRRAAIAAAEKRLREAGICLERDPTDVIMADPELSDGARINLYWLWHLAGRRPNRILTNKHELAALAHRDIRTIDGNLKRLRTAGRIDLEWDKQRGAIEVYVYHPASNKPEARPDPQRVLGFHSADEAMPEPPAGEQQLPGRPNTPI